MNTLKDWHPDIEEFIEAKQKEETKAWALIEQGYDGSYNGDAYGSVMYQNENLSRARERRVHERRDRGPRMVDAPGDRRPALREEGRARRCCARSPKARTSAAIPGCSSTPPSTSGTPAKAPAGRIPPIPAREYLFLDNTACNLASLNLMKFKTRGRRIRCRALQGGRAHLHHRAGNHRR